MFTFDSKKQLTRDAVGESLGGHFKTHDGRTVDSTGAFFVGELERLDQTLNLPLVDITWSRDIDLRNDVTVADEYSSFTNTTVASNGGLGTGQGVGTGKAWMGRNSTQIAGVGIDISKTPNPLNVWGLEVKYDILELAAAARIGRPIDSQKVDAMELKRQMDIDEQVYIGDLTLNIGGLYNSAAVTNVTNFPPGASGFTQWAEKTPDEILADITMAMTSVWKASGYAIRPNRILLPPAQFAQICMQKVATQAGLVSVRNYVEQNNLMTSNGGGKLTIDYCKWGVGAGAGGTYQVPGTVDRMIVYTKDYKRVRFPLTLVQRTPVQYEGIWHKVYYFHKMGGIEMPYANTIGYQDGL
jgi:hypothetical protein